ncbi:MAG: type II methionyl aminopeptidase [ANME-2 cluster archaeon]|nr:type II methionyl aminopeptidase [ANME-2 cluster archaeon]
MLADYREAGRIALKVKDEAIKTVEAGVGLLETAEYAEELTRQMGGEAAFPCNISINEIASHYTPLRGIRKFAVRDLVKIDVGVHVDGYIADTAATVEVETHYQSVLIEAAQKALDAAINEIRADVTTKHLGTVMEQTITANGCRPVPDLTGHGIGRYTIHNGMNIPNHGGAAYSNTIHVGDVIAVEPFTTKGSGQIKHGETRIVCLMHNKKTTHPIFQDVMSQFNTLPFTSRWMQNPDDLTKMRVFLRKYPMLIEKDGCPVAQAEHTIIVKEDGCEVITA